MAPFILLYIRLILLFKNEMSREELNVIEERQKQMRGEEFSDDKFDELLGVVRKKIDQDIKNDTSTTKKSMLNRLLFCALLDSEESDFFYLTEPAFEFVKKLDVSPDELLTILESEFKGFKVWLN